ncbi:ferredoxin [Spinactinospora alkalitolerans]|uniref:Ferredoxin n=1 Tax=Spinactinospora alkalitolerans TaxID=687207 RepID=A0A852TUZ0_9ACTN|nr:2Fe-2S iron-sulfur cluster binding domain-containing protein [Spinactinospora alkalitolerans]NYE47117.1 ferredoxin [Spinactinospora alkalitolerans]
MAVNTFATSPSNGGTDPTAVASLRVTGKVEAADGVVAAAEEAGTGGRRFDVELRRSGTTLTVGSDRSLLQVLGEAGVHVLSSCRQGLCGTCETAVLSGVPDHRDSILDEDDRAAGDCMFVCVSRARSERLVLDL